MENRNGKVEDVYWFWKVINSFNITKGFCWSVVQSFWLLFTSRNQYAHQKANDENYCEDITNIRNRCQPATKIRWTYKFQKLYLCYVGWNQWLWVQVLRMYTGCMVLQPRTIDMILGFSPCFPSARTCYPWNTGPEPVLSTHTLTL